MIDKLTHMIECMRLQEHCAGGLAALVKLGM